MNNYLDLSILEIHNLLKEKKIKPLDLVMEAFERIEEKKELNVFITLCKEEAIKKAKELEEKDVDNILFGIPVAIKDNISTKDIRTTCASKMLENYIPLYNATVIDKINEKNMIIIGKTNMDEFAMGSTSRTSYFGPSLNAVDKTRIAGGSSGGSASAVAAHLIPISLGSDTGGSIRQPASYNGIVGMKPTYGSISRYGLVAFASSLDQIGPMSRNVYENALFLNTLIGKDEKDLTTTDRVEDFTRYIGEDIKGMKIGVPEYFMKEDVNPEIKNHVEKIISMLKEHGATVEYITIDYIENAVTLYQIIAMGEASSNLARFDGIRYGYASSDREDLDMFYKKTRAEGFGEEVKRRIMVGSYLLSGENAEIYYNKALSIRDDIKKSFEKAFANYDLIIGPTTTTTAYKLTDDLDNPIKAFLDDILVIPVNMAGLPGMSIPIGKDETNLPIGLHIIGNFFEEAIMYKLAAFIETELKKIGEGK